MIKKISAALNNKGVRTSVASGLFGLEKENVRVDSSGKMASTPHPGILGNKFVHPFITADFSESQVEMITPPLHSIAEAHGFLETLNDVVSENLGDELLWPQSLPPILPGEEEIPIANFGEEGIEKELYRKILAERYGRERQMLSGIHFNYSLSPRLEKKLMIACGWKNGYQEFRSEIYLKIVRNFMRFRWLLVWLFGESPEAHHSLRFKSLKTGEKRQVACRNAVSVRASSKGYTNVEEYYINFNSLQEYKQSLQQLIDSGKLLGERELYQPIRLKFNPGNNEISHIEVRLLDIDPFEKSGISKNRLMFIHQFLIFCLFFDEEEKYSKTEQQIADKNQNTVACMGMLPDVKIDTLKQGEILVKEALKELFTAIKKVIIQSGFAHKKAYWEAFCSVEDKINNPESRKCYRLQNAIDKEGFIAFHLKQANAYKADSKINSFRFLGFEDLELSSQLLLKAALRRGVEFKILDRADNFISLHKNGKTEYVMQATRTSLDNYSGVLMMENKLVTKKILRKSGICVPSGFDYCDAEQARSDFDLYEGRSIVIKPKSTNFGKGITILKSNKNRAVYERAVDIAFGCDCNVLIEEFVEGKEYRFFVINDQVVGILRRIPANVIGDGVKTIRQLVELKNTNSLRGKGYRTPLEKIMLGELEAMFLQEQGLNFESVPAKDEVVYLRENSNVSTGGDTIDVTDEVHYSYKETAVKAAQELGVKITGLDIIIKDKTQPVADDNYAVIEMNFNPAIHIHCYPYKGINRMLNEKILDALGF